MSAPVTSRVVLVSGGSKGVGRALVEHFLNRGDSVATFARKKTEYVEALQGQLGETRFLWGSFDITDTDKVVEFVRTVMKRYGRVDVLINNAAIAYDGLLATMRSDEIEKMIAVNLTATMQLTRACIKFMIKEASGSIINISSIMGHSGFAGVSVYSATKGGLDSFTRSLAREVGGRGVRVNTIAPGYMETELTHALTPIQRRQILTSTPMNRLGTVEDVVGAVEYFASTASKFVTGQSLTIDGGFTC